MIAAFFGGVALVLVAWLWLTHRAWAMDRSEWARMMASADLQLRDANNRLHTAWKDGAIIPPTDIPVHVDPRDEAVLQPELLDFLDQYTGDARLKYERMIRSKLGKLTPLQILKEFESPLRPDEAR